MELMVTIAIAAILIAIAVPSFTGTIASNRLTSNANQFLSALSYARSEAIKRGLQVTILNRGASNQWESGWDTFVDLNGNNAFDDNGDTNLCQAGEDCMLRSYDALPASFTFRSNGTSFQSYAAYLANGSIKNGNGVTYTLCSSTGTAMPQRSIVISNTGRPRVSVTTGACP